MDRSIRVPASTRHLVAFAADRVAGVTPRRATRSVDKPSDPWQRHNLGSWRWPRRHRPSVGCVLSEPQVATVLAIGADVGLHEPHEVAAAQDDDVVQQLAPT